MRYNSLSRLISSQDLLAGYRICLECVVKTLLKTRGVIKVRKESREGKKSRISSESRFLLFPVKYMLHWFWAQSEIDGGHQRDKLLLHTFMDVKTKITTAKLSYCYTLCETSSSSGRPLPQRK